MSKKLPDKKLPDEKLLPAKVWTPDPRILLCPQVPKPLHQVCPRTILGQKWWDKTRKEAYASTDWHCEACGVFKLDAKGRPWLEGHELYKINYLVGLMTYVRAIPLCHYCHNYIHVGRLNALLEKGEIHHAKYVAIIQHGDAVLTSVGERRLEPLEQGKGKIAPWAKWRLLLEGKKYPPKFPNYEEWESYWKAQPTKEIDE